MRQRAEWRDRHKMIYDTGAQVTSMSREMCDRLRIDWRRTTNYTMQSVRGVGNTSTPCKVLHDVEFYICIDSPLKVTAQWAKVKVDVYADRVFDTPMEIEMNTHLFSYYPTVQRS